MTLTLAHEMVHLVRFGQGLACFELPERLRDAEERRVRRISEQAVLDVVGPEHRPRVAELLAARDDGPA
jgi:hypothetical protein